MSEKFIFPIRIYYEDTDVFGMVYHSNFLKYMERARTEWLRTLLPNFGLEEANVYFVVSEASLKFLKPCHLHDLLEVVTTVTKTTFATILFSQKIRRMQDPSYVCCEGEVKIVSVDKMMRPCALPQTLLKEFKRDE